MYIELFVACALRVYYLLLICLQRNCIWNYVCTCYVTVYVTVYVPDYVTGICVLGSGTNEGSSPRSDHGGPPSLVPTHPRRTRGVKACRSSRGDFGSWRYNGCTVL